MTKFRAYLSNDYYIITEDEDGTHAEWASEVLPDFGEVDIKELGTAVTLEDAKQLIYNSGRIQDYYGACFIASEDDGEVYSSIPEVNKCECCGHEVWNRFESNN